MIGIRTSNSEHYVFGWDVSLMLYDYEDKECFEAQIPPVLRKQNQVKPARLSKVNHVCRPRHYNIHTNIDDHINDPVIRLRISHSEGFHADRYTFISDGETVMEKTKPSDYVTLNGWDMMFLTEEDIAAIKKIASSRKTTLVLHNPNKSYESVEVTDNQKLGMELILAKHDELKRKQR